MADFPGIPYQDNALVQNIAVEGLWHQAIPITSVATLLNISYERTDILVHNPSESGYTIYVGGADVTCLYGVSTRGIPIESGQSPVDFDLSANAKLYAIAKESDIQVAATLDVDTIEWQSANTIRYAFNGSPDLSAITDGMWLKVESATNASNNGIFEITNVSAGSFYVDVTNASRSDATDDEATDSTAVCSIEDLIWVTVMESR